MFALLRPGDWLILAGGLGFLAALWGHTGGGDTVLIKQEGRVFMEVSPRLDRIIDVPGPLGVTLVEIQSGKVRIKSDPGPQQVCVKQGWLMPGQVAICLPNRVSVERGFSQYDSLNY